MLPASLPASEQRSKLSQHLLTVFGYTASAAALWWVFRKFPLAQLEHDLRTLHWGWVALCVGLDTAVHFVDGWRWQLILKPFQKTSFWRCVQAVFVGIFANDVIPGRAGEIIRCYTLSLWSEIPFPVTFASSAIERLMDGLILIVIFGLAVVDLDRVPGWLTSAMLLFTTVVGGLSGLLLFVIFWKQSAHDFAARNKYAARFGHMLDDLHRLGDWRTLGQAMLVSVPGMLLQAGSVWALAHAYNFDFGLRESAFVLLVVRLATMVPSAPAGLGAYQWACIKALNLMSVESDAAKSFSAIMFSFLTLPALLGGAIAVSVMGASIMDLKRHAEHAHAVRRMQRVQEEAKLLAAKKAQEGAPTVTED